MNCLYHYSTHPFGQGWVMEMHYERSNPMDFRPLNDTERKQLLTALHANAKQGQAILTNPRDTGFAGTAEAVTDEEVISAIKSVPCHY
jgi:hypothetical protein